MQYIFLQTFINTPQLHLTSALMYHTLCALLGIFIAYNINLITVLCAIILQPLCCVQFLNVPHWVAAAPADEGLSWFSLAEHRRSWCWRGGCASVCGGNCVRALTPLQVSASAPPPSSPSFACISIPYSSSCIHNSLFWKRHLHLLTLRLTDKEALLIVGQITLWLHNSASACSLSLAGISFFCVSVPSYTCPICFFYHPFRDKT